MAASANSISLASGGSLGSLAAILAKVNNVYYHNAAITAATITSGIEATRELPIIADSFSMNMGDVDKTETKLTTGQIWVSRAEKGDSDISMNIGAFDKEIASMFMEEKAAQAVSEATIMGVKFSGVGYSSAIKKVSGALILMDESKSVCVILANVEMYGTPKVDGDNPGYIEVSITPKDNTEGVAVYIFEKKAA